MGRVATVISDIKFGKYIIDLGGGITQEVFYSTPFGLDAPLPKDTKVFIEQVPKTGKYIILGILEKDKETEDTLLYTQSSGGSVVAEVRLKKSGDIVVKNNLGSMVLEASGSFNINGVVIGLDGSIYAPGGVRSGSSPATTVSLNNHTHAGNGLPPTVPEV